MAGAPEPDLQLAAALFAALSRATRRGRGIVRDSYGPGEQAAHDIARSAANAIGLEVFVDAIGNLSMTLPGRNRAAPRVMIGSHLDSVPQGGNFDGATGVVAGLSVLSGLRRAGGRAGLRHLGDGDPRRGVRLVRRRLPGQRRRVRPPRPGLPVSPPIRQWPDAGGDARPAGL